MSWKSLEGLARQGYVTNYVTIIDDALVYEAKMSCNLRRETVSLRG